MQSPTTNSHPTVPSWTNHEFWYGLQCPCMSWTRTRWQAMIGWGKEREIGPSEALYKNENNEQSNSVSNRQVILNGEIWEWVKCNVKLWFWALFLSVCWLWCYFFVVVVFFLFLQRFHPFPVHHHCNFTPLLSPSFFLFPLFL